VLFAIMHMDMVAYSKLIGLDDIGTVERLRELRLGPIDRQVRQHGGRTVKVAGDSFLIVFDNITQAVRCAVTLQREIPLHQGNWPADRRMRFRIGIDIGEVIVDGTDIHGDGVNIAARLQAACPPGGICLSAAVHRHVESGIDVVFQPLGLLTLKNITEPVEAFAVQLDADGPPEWSAALAYAASALPEPEQRRAWATPAGGPPVVAVLPFQQFDGNALPRHISDGIATDIICQLAGLRDLSVISHGSTLGLRDASGDSRELGRRLGAQYVIRGALRHDGVRSRLIAELSDAGSGVVVWARATEVENLLDFGTQDRVVGQIVNTLAPRVQDFELHRIRGKRPESLSVYEKVLLAREHMQMLQRDGFQQSKQLLDEVIAAEPGYAEAYALAADWHGLVIGQGWSADRDADVAAVNTFARRALALDGDNVRALVCYAHRRSLLHRDYATAQAMFCRALDLAPNAAQAWLRSSYTYAYIGEADEAVRRAERALELSPCDHDGHLFCSALCVAHYTAGNYDVAAEWGLRTLTNKTMLRNTAAWAAASLAAAGRVDEARDLATRTKEQWPHRQVHNAVARHPYQDPDRRRRYGEHLLAAGFPP
jgi:adenylate cyclase